MVNVLMILIHFVFFIKPGIKFDIKYDIKADHNMVPNLVPCGKMWHEPGIENPVSTMISNLVKIAVSNVVLNRGRYLGSQFSPICPTGSLKESILEVCFVPFIIIS